VESLTEVTRDLLVLLLILHRVELVARVQIAS